MSSWAEDSEQMAEEVHDAFSRPVLYHDPSLQSPATIHCPVGHERTERRPNEYGGIELVSMRDVWVLDAAQDIRLDGVFTIDGKRYNVKEANPRIGGRTHCRCQSVSAVEKSRPRYRG